MQIIELVREHLRSKLGVRKIPLSYVIREDHTFLALGMIRSGNPFSIDIHFFHEDLIERISHDPQNYVDDNAMVLDILAGCLKSTQHMSDIKSFQRTKDGRRAPFALELNNMGLPSGIRLYDLWKITYYQSGTVKIYDIY